MSHPTFLGDGLNATSAYDANGNILGMTQKGLMLNVSSPIDQLTYTYNTNSNKLLKVADAITAQNNLGDFNNGTSGTGNDYTYDGNGNLTLDNNKNISSITYNYLNLPSVITITGKGTITYTYDAGGNKLQKQTIETSASVPLNGTNYTSSITTTTNYISGFVYESKAYSNAALSSLQYTDVLQYIGTEEGRINATKNAYEYFLKDHLGNTRMVLTEAAPVNYYPAATLEGTYDASTNSMVNYERNFYNISSSYIVPETTIPSWGTETIANTKLYYNNNNSPTTNVTPITPPNLSYPTGCTPTQTDGSNNLYKLNAATNRTGLEFMIKVMAGDHLDIFGKSYYLNTTNITNANSTTLDVATLMTNFLLAPANVAAGKGFTSSVLGTINGGSTLSSFFHGNNNEPMTQVPKAYINYIFFDEQFKYVTGSGWSSRVGSSGTVLDHWATDSKMQNIIVPQNGYIFVYVSNESNFDVFFDNLQVVDKPGAIVEENHYYPFGLTMAGISSQAAGGLENKYKFNKGSELQHKEFSDSANGGVP